MKEWLFFEQSREPFVYGGWIASSIRPHQLEVVKLEAAKVRRLWTHMSGEWHVLYEESPHVGSDKRTIGIP